MEILGIDNSLIAGIWSIFSTISSIIVLLGAVYTIFLIVSGFLPALWRLGNGLKRKKIAVFAKGDELASLMKLLRDTKLFNNGKIDEIATSGDIESAKGAATYLVFWSDWEERDIRRIVATKEDRVSLIVFAPPRAGRVSPEMTAWLEGFRNVVLVNFRGRLLNDIIVSMITAGHE